MSGTLTVMISPQIEEDVRDLVGYFFLPVHAYVTRHRVLPNEIGLAGNCRIVVDSAGLTNVRAVKAIIWGNCPNIGAVDGIVGLLSARKPRLSWWSFLASRVGMRQYSGESMGWLRRPELDTETIDAWELPDGTVKATQKGVSPVLVRFDSLF